MRFRRPMQVVSIALITLLSACGRTTSDPPSSSAAKASASASAPAPASASASATLAPAPAPADPQSEGLKGIGEPGGCPCGCDHSEAMAAELEARGGEGARADIERSLKTIAEREDAGYITEAMVEHRLRLLGLLRAPSKGSTIAKPAGLNAQSVDRGVPFEPALAKLPASAPVVERGALRGRAVLTAHGEATEIVNGHEKPLRASFRVGLELENLSAKKLALELPTIEGRAGYPISRWYELSGDGRPWDGSLAAGEKKVINIIGYLADHVKPGTDLEARVHVQSLVFETKTKARRRWNKPE